MINYLLKVENFILFRGKTNFGQLYTSQGRHSRIKVEKRKSVDIYFKGGFIFNEIFLKRDRIKTLDLIFEKE